MARIEVRCNEQAETAALIARGGAIGPAVEFLASRACPQECPSRCQPPRIAASHPRAPGALARYAMRRKPRVETLQDDSRRLASMMMIESLELSWGRDKLMKFYTLDMLAKNIAQSLAKPI